MTPSPDRLTLRALPFASRLVLAAFLISVGVGYFSALVQLHFQHAPAGKALPEAEDAAHVYSGKAGVSALERLLVASEGKPFNGSGQMRAAFTTKSAGWPSQIRKQAKAEKAKPSDVEARFRIEREGERLGLLAWIKVGADKKAFDENGFVLPEALAAQPITAKYVEDAGGKKRLKIASLIEDRCTRCHSENVGGAAGNYPLDTYDDILAYAEPEAGGGMSLDKLAQSTHVHLLGFSMLYGLTGLIFSFTSYPAGVRWLVAPWPLLVQLVDIACWWLARLDPAYSQVIVVTGGFVAVGLLLQIVLGLFNLFDRTGKVVVAVLLLAAAGGGYVLKTSVIDPHLTREAGSAASTP
jgi:hypothetical protein